jgi:tRNA(Arg) A34 adenosine deaminase TadA
MLVTLEPCDMCKTVIKEARIDKVFYIVPRYSFKKQNKCTAFENLTLDNDLERKYKEDIETFFAKKR